MKESVFSFVEVFRKALKLRKELFFTEGHRVLDIGSGQRPRGNLCLDKDPRTEPDVVGFATQIPFQAECIDEVVCYHLVEHLLVPETERLFSEVRRVLVPGGTAHFLVDRDVGEQALLDKDDDHVTRYDVETVETMAEDFFTIECSQTKNWLGNINKYGLGFWKYLGEETKVYLEVKKESR